MAELLIKAKNYVDPDPDMDRRDSYKKGMIICVKPDGYPWGRLESKQQWLLEGNDAADWHNKTVIVKILGLDPAIVADIVFIQDVDDTGAPMPLDINGTPQRYRRRAWHLLIDNIPAGIKTTLQTDGEVTVTKLQVRDYLKRIRNNDQYTGLD